MERVIERQQLPMSVNWKVTRTTPGTRRYGPYVEEVNEQGIVVFKGHHLIDPGDIVEVLEGHNLIVTLGQSMIGLALIDSAAQYDTGITYCALGADNTAPALTDTQLVDEGGGAAMRKTVTSKTQAVAPNTNQFTFSTFFTAGESTLAIEEAGMFGTSTAGAGENSGVLFSRWLVSINNAGATSDITIDYVLTIG